MTRHQSLVAKHDAIYRNHHAMMKNARRHTSVSQYHSDGKTPPNFNRPLPPLPKAKSKSKPADEDEDYWSGSHEDADFTPMKRELSEWEIREQTKNRFKNKYL